MTIRDESLQLIKRGADEIINEQELSDRLEQGRPLRVKAGFDPNAPRSTPGSYRTDQQAQTLSGTGTSCDVPDR